MKALMEHRWLRRGMMIPLVFVVTIGILGLLPVWFLVAACASMVVPGRWRTLRLCWFVLVFLVLQALALVALGVLWMLDGFGLRDRSEASLRRHYRVMGWYLNALVGSAKRTFGLRFVHDGDDLPFPEVVEQRRNGGLDGPDPSASVDPRRPLLVFSRHSGPGDSLLLVNGVRNGAGRRPRIVLKDFLQMDPSIDLLLNRLPSRFVPTFGRSREGVVDAVGELARTCGPKDALVLFPEGGNFTTQRHARSVEQLEEIGRPELAQRARDLGHLLPPKPAGVMAAIAAAPEAQVVFVGHVGLERLGTVRDLWRNMPMDNVVHVRQWRFQPADLPAPEDRELWLYDQWEVIDTWIESHLE